MAGLPTTILSIREYISLSLRELPLIVIVAPFFLGVSQGNINLLMFSIGTAIVAPASAGIIGSILGFILKRFNPSGSIWKLPASDVSSLVVGLPEAFPNRDSVSVVPTYWMTIVVFFFTYLATNSVSLYMQDSAPGAPADKVENRKSQATMSFILILVLAVIIILTKIRLIKGENMLGLITALAVGISTAYGWFTFLKQCGMGRLEDVFGIQARILPESTFGNSPVVCVSPT